MSIADIRPDLCIVIPTFNRKKELSIILKQLLKQQVRDVTYKIIVAVDGSTDGTLELLRSEFPEVIIVVGNGNWWFTKSINEGCKHAIEVLKTKLILTINDDVQIPDNYLSAILKNYKDSGKDCIIGSSSYSLSEPRVITFSGYKSENRILYKYERYVKPYSQINPTDLNGVVTSITLPTRGMLVSSDVMKSINYLDEKTFPQYASDYDFVLRASKKGVKIYLSYDAYVFENMQLTSLGNPRLTKSWKDYLHNIFFNKYSSNYFLNRMHMNWRFGIKILFPVYFWVALASIPYIYIKYKFSVNKKIKDKN